MSWKRFSADYLAFSRKERIAILSLLCIILIIYLIPLFLSYSAPPVVFRLESFAASGDSLSFNQHKIEAEEEAVHEPWYTPSASKSAGERFPFDPNLASKADWLRLGLSEKTAATIERYRNKGGRFYRKEDLKRIWGLPPGFYESVEEFILIPTKDKPQYPSYDRKEFSPRNKIPANISINSADSSAFEALPGIGARLSARIVGFREKLGGFYSIDQVGETYGLPDSTFQKIRPLLSLDHPDVRTININTATKEELKAHPYIRWNLANAIVAYRLQHGNFLSVEELKKIAVIDDATYEKLYRYLRTE